MLYTPKEKMAPSVYFKENCENYFNILYSAIFPQELETGLEQQNTSQNKIYKSNR